MIKITFRKVVSWLKQWLRTAISSSNAYDSSNRLHFLPGAALPLRALIIGIDRYSDRSIHNLHSSVVDAFAFKQFLYSNGVKEEHIKLLLNEDASCARIEEEVRALGKSRNPVFVYFAGHGSTGAWSSKATLPNRRCVKVLVPQDFSRDGPERGILVEGVLSGLSRNNVVLLTDCCYPDQVSNLPPMELVRGISLPETSLVTGDLSLDNKRDNGWLSWLTSPLHSLRSKSSYIFLSACRDGELARETVDHGVFTEGLLRRLWCGNVNQLTYEDLSRLASDERQNPSCEGPFKSRRLVFDGKSRSLNLEREHCFVRPSSIPGKCLLSVGHALGVTPGVEFCLYADPLHSKEIGRLVICESSAFGSVAELSLCKSDSDPSHWTLGYALKAQDGMHGGLRVLVLSKLRDQIRNLTNPDIFLLNDFDRNPDLVMRCDSDAGQTSLEILHPAMENGFELPFKVPTSLDTLCQVLQRAEAFIWHIRNYGRHGPIASKVIFECRHLVESNGDDFFQPGWIEENTVNLINEDHTLNAKVGEKYGFIVTNKSAVDVFCALVYFDMSDWSITLFYQTRINEPIPPGGSFTFGYGQSYTDRPVIYFLRQGQDVDHGFLKLYISTVHVDYSDITQTPVLGSEALRKTGDFHDKSRRISSESVLVRTVQR